jgi:hypothetical protein
VGRLSKFACGSSETAAIIKQLSRGTSLRAGACRNVRTKRTKRTKSRCEADGRVNRRKYANKMSAKSAINAISPRLEAAGFDCEPKGLTALYGRAG